MPSPADWVQIASAVGTVAAAVVGWRAAVAARASADAANKQLPELRKQVEASNAQAIAAQQQVELAQRAAQDASQAAREAVRARADDRAPHIIVALKEPDWPPYVDSNRSTMPYANELRILDKESVERSTQDMKEFLLSKHGSWFLWFKGTGFLVNEGPTAARIRISGEVELYSTPYFGEQNPTFASSYPVLPAQRVGDAARREYLVAPGTAIEFGWAIGATVQEWAAKHDAPHAAGGEIHTTAWSYGDAGTLDIIVSEFRARPLQPDPHNTNQWNLVEDTLGRIGVVTYPPKRTWLFENRIEEEESKG